MARIILKEVIFIKWQIKIYALKKEYKIWYAPEKIIIWTHE
ncbi:MAG: hypothetical protein MRECE_8c008 [Mycoplasmataceae bacterium CE_OT135]|nr:MAG: hypothetical protein MRECE_8c008 [Mycoplasmataceae bacterium CE_OT135]